MVRVASMTAARPRPAPLEAVLEQTSSEIPGAEGRPKARGHGFAVLFAACVELQEVCCCVSLQRAANSPCRARPPGVGRAEPLTPCPSDQLLRATEDERDVLRDANGALRRQVQQLQSRCSELTERARRLEDGERGLPDVGVCVCGGARAPSAPIEPQHAVPQGGPHPARQPSTRPPQVPPLHALLRGNFLVDGSSEGRQSLGHKEGVPEAGVLQEDDGDVDLDEIPVGHDIWALMDHSVRMRIEQWVTEQGRAVRDYGPLSELARSVDGGSHGRSSARYSVSHAPSATDYGSVTYGQYGEDEGLLSLCDDESSSDSDDDGYLQHESAPAGLDEADLLMVEDAGGQQRGSCVGGGSRRRAGRCSDDRVARHGEQGAAEPSTLPENADRWNIDAQEDEWRLAKGADAEELVRMQRRAAQRRIRLRSSVESGPVFSQTLFGRMMCMQDRAPGVLHEALTADLPF